MKGTLHHTEIDDAVAAHKHRDSVKRAFVHQRKLQEQIKGPRETQMLTALLFAGVSAEGIYFAIEEGSYTLKDIFPDEDDMRLIRASLAALNEVFGEKAGG